ncbi:hypothetical protein DSC45_35140 [Streptomyces sp. YIM 130001]|uniref:DUF1702 family protein n=1 Tax=Streptomyces sp. YIM 130001 TaxID=2259644 RepID=UPI000E65569A|nr:DUF1702 family protein [Streptomyces sp. YIM 130001]RII06884.1 hypothetical protein DSC45_35140 [Streptomyces sp. YIM 130001]
MAVIGTLRRVLMAPSLVEVGFARRGFPVESTAVTRRLEHVPRAVVCGFEWGIEASSLPEAECRLAMVDLELQGFAYEGATMACVIRDVMGPGRGTRTRDLLTGGGARHIFLNYIGIGFAMARLPRLLWKKVLPELTDAASYPQMHWLAVDGYGFDKAYFHTPRFVDDQRVPEAYPWQGDSAYFLRAVDQGIGRALWFIHGASAGNVVAAVRRFAVERQPDLWSGVGLAATFAGCCAPTGLETLRTAAGEHWAHLAQGAVFAAKARDHAQAIPEHTHAAVHTLAGLSVRQASGLADDCAVPDDESGTCAYELWRRAVRSKLPDNQGR